MKLQGIRNLVLIRHGESLRNISECKGSFYQNDADRERVGVLQDRLVPLTEKGHQQAKATGLGLKSEFGLPDMLIHSGFLRTQETTAGILGAYMSEGLVSLRIWENHLVRERNPGYLMNWTEMEVRDRVYWWLEYWRTADKFTVVPMGGESIAGMTEGRLLTFLKILESNSNKKGGNTIFVVSHGRAILGMRYILEDWGYDRIISALDNENPPNCSATHYLFDAFGNPHLQYANKKFS